MYNSSEAYIDMIDIDCVIEFQAHYLVLWLCQLWITWISMKQICFYYIETSGFIVHFKMFVRKFNTKLRTA